MVLSAGQAEQRACMGDACQAPGLVCTLRVSKAMLGRHTSSCLATSSSATWPYCHYVCRPAFVAYAK